jgi:hypothetical protein
MKCEDGLCEVAVEEVAVKEIVGEPAVSEAGKSAVGEADLDTYSLVADVLAKVRGELDDHREAINENTNEITLNQEFLGEISSRIDRLAERIDELTLFVKGSGKSSQASWDIKPLSEREKEVFHAFYVLCEQKNNAVTYKELAQQLDVGESTAAGFMTSFVAKGIPLVKRYHAGRAYVGMEQGFRMAQAQRNIVGLSTLLTYWQQT